MAVKKIYPTDEQIKTRASRGYKNGGLIGSSNPNLIDMAFEWRNAGPTSQILHFKELRSKDINYAPSVILSSPPVQSYYYKLPDRINTIRLRCDLLGFVTLYFDMDCKVTLLAPLKNSSNVLSANTYVLTLDYILYPSRK